MADLAQADRESKMLARYIELGKQPEATRNERLLEMVRADFALPEDKLKSFTLSRMRVFLKLPPEPAKTMAAAYDTVMLKMPASAAMRRVTLVQTLAKDFTPDEEERLRELNPNLFAGLPSRKSEKERTDLLSAKAKAETAQRSAASGKSGWWPFGKK